MNRLAILLAISAITISCAERYDVVVIGGGTGGTAAAVEAARNGAKVLVVEGSPWLGGMLTSAGVSAVDGNYRLHDGVYNHEEDLGADWHPNYKGHRKVASALAPHISTLTGWPLPEKAIE